MGSKYYGIPLILVLMFSLSCKSKDQFESTAYPLKIVDSTGITTFLVVHGKRINIKFNEYSNKQKLHLLMALRWYVLYPNTDPKAASNLFIVGKLHDKEKKTERCDVCPEQEVYQEFELHNWYFHAPFKEMTYNGGIPNTLLDDPSKIAIIERKTLTLKDFESFKGIESSNLRELLRN